ncbi:thiolase family protein [Actinomadura sp. 9N215]|uniref:thiolase family protein n=1 Tax=Actinomadura sp. 9N215 TaxID=3375150 RepID=UPI0037BA832E
MTEQVAVAGVGMHEFGRFPGSSLKDLARVAIVRALDDAGLGVKDIECVYSSNALAGVLQGQEQIRGQSVLRDVGIERVPVINVENACAGASTAFAQAVLAIRAGAARAVLVVGFEKMFVGDTARSLDALESAADIEVVAGLGLQFTAIYAMRVRKRMDAGALTRRHLLDVAVKSHSNGALNPYAQHRKVFSAQEIADSPPIADPLTLFMCSSICDGASAAVLVAADHPAAQRHPTVIVRASALASGYAHVEPSEPSIVTLCAQKAYEEAAIGPQDLDVVEVHDAMAPGELLYYEQLGLCADGEAGALLDSGATSLTGRTPVNPSGGLCSRGHPVGATGLAQLAEIVWQLRGQAGRRQAGRPRIGLAQNSGGWLEGDPAAVSVHILERTPAWD